MKKTFVAGALAFTMAAAFLSGCGSNTQTKAANRLEEIQQRGYIEVATEPYFAPNEFIDSSKSGDEQYVGSDIEMAKYIADKLGVELKIVPLEFAAVLSSVTEGKYDLAISALAYTPERAEAMNLSNGYYFDDEEDGYGLLVREEDVDYLYRMQRVYESEIGRMQDTIDNSKNSREVSLATKRKEKLQKQLKECREYDEKIGHLALSRIELDLDDGVKVNYRKVQTASDGKFYEILADSKNIMAKEK